MHLDTEGVRRIAQAEKEMCHRLGPALHRMIRDIAERYRVDIHEVRVTIKQSEIEDRRQAANCVIIR